MHPRSSPTFALSQRSSSKAFKGGEFSTAWHRQVTSSRPQGKGCHKGLFHCAIHISYLYDSYLYDSYYSFYIIYSSRVVLVTQNPLVDLGPWLLPGLFRFFTDPSQESVPGLAAWMPGLGVSHALKILVRQSQQSQQWQQSQLATAIST